MWREFDFGWGKSSYCTSVSWSEWWEPRWKYTASLGSNSVPCSVFSSNNKLFPSFPERTLLKEVLAKPSENPPEGRVFPKLLVKELLRLLMLTMLLKVAFALGLIFPLLVWAVLKALLVIPIKWQLLGPSTVPWNTAPWPPAVMTTLVVMVFIRLESSLQAAIES